MPFCRVAGPLRFSVGFPRHGSQTGSLGLAEWPSGLGKGLQSPVHGFDSRLRLAGGWRSGSAQPKRPGGKPQQVRGRFRKNFTARHWFGYWLGAQEGLSQ